MCFALADDPAFEGLDDPLVLELAAPEQRVLITRNSRDFAPLAREWAEAQRHHAGMILIWTLDHGQFAEIVAGVERHFDAGPSRTVARPRRRPVRAAVPFRSRPNRPPRHLPGRRLSRWTARRGAFV